MLDEMAEFIGEVSSRTVYLAIAASGRYSDMLDVVEHFGVIGVGDVGGSI
jgi:flagellar biosynthesis GTPase FlhF